MAKYFRSAVDQSGPSVANLAQLLADGWGRRLTPDKKRKPIAKNGRLKIRVPHTGLPSLGVADPWSVRMTELLSGQEE